MNSRWTMRAAFRTALVAGVALILPALGACRGPAEPTVGQIAVATATAEKAADALVKSLMERLAATLESGPPAEALSVCADVSAVVSDETSTLAGAQVRRTALRLRNPENAPDEHERAVLERWLAASRSEREPDVTVARKGEGYEVRLMRPIHVLPLCTRCHGPREGIEKDVLDVLAERYPDDKATGFEPGDLRGAVTVRVPIE